MVVCLFFFFFCKHQRENLRFQKEGPGRTVRLGKSIAQEIKTTGRQTTANYQKPPHSFCSCEKVELVF